jgi:hypothetical protein
MQLEKTNYLKMQTEVPRKDKQFLLHYYYLSCYLS